MFDIAPTELLLCAVVALLVIGPKDLPKAMRVVGHWVGRARGVARHFRAGFDTMVREAELEEMENKWREENERIMREHPADPAPVADPLPDLVAVPEPAVETPSPSIAHAATVPEIVTAADESPAPKVVTSADAPAMLPMPLPEAEPKAKRTKKA